MPYNWKLYRTKRRTDQAARQAAARSVAQSIARAAVPKMPMPIPSATTGEFKSIDNATATAADSGTAVVLLNGCARGDDIATRSGRETVMMSIQFKAYFGVTAGTGTDQLQRALLVYDRQTNGAALTAAQVLSTANVVAPRSLENRKRFKILMDKTVTLNASGEPGSNEFFQFYRRLRHPVEYNSGNAGTVADITTGSLYLVVIGSNAAGATAGALTWNSRIRFLDK